MGLPSHPRVKGGGKPKPFQRPSVDLGGAPTAKREWRQIPASRIQEGDTVPGIGVVREVEALAIPTYKGRTYRPVIVRGGQGNAKAFDADAPIFCFTAARGD